jgi:hypothetical protein
MGPVTQVVTEHQGKDDLKYNDQYLFSIYIVVTFHFNDHDISYIRNDIKHLSAGMLYKRQSGVFLPSHNQV